MNLATKPQAITKIIISCVGSEARWSRRIRLYLKATNQKSDLSIIDKWSIDPGDNVKMAFTAALAQASVVIPLVSTSYLASDQIWSDELPQLIDAAKRRKFQLFPVIVHACAYNRSPLAQLHPFNPPTSPLSAMSPSQRREALLRLSTYVLESDSKSRGSNLPRSMVAMDELLSDNNSYLRSVRARRYIRNLPLGLEQELSSIFFNISDIQRIIINSERILTEAFPCIPGEPLAVSLPLSYVVFSSGARVAWESAASEASRVGPLALAALLLAARTETDNNLPIVQKTLSMILAREE